jgi:hypothetical protein
MSDGEYKPDTTSDSAGDNDYTNRSGQGSEGVPVEKDSDQVDSGVNPQTEDSDEQLGM